MPLHRALSTFVLGVYYATFLLLPQHLTAASSQPVVLGCTMLSSAECLTSPHCRWDFACRQCLDKPCECMLTEGDCRSATCTWDMAESACRRNTTECAQWSTQPLCTQATCQWDPMGSVCVQGCGQLADQERCLGNPHCIFADGRCTQRFRREQTQSDMNDISKDCAACSTVDQPELYDETEKTHYLERQQRKTAAQGLSDTEQCPPSNRDTCDHPNEPFSFVVIDVDHPLQKPHHDRARQLLVPTVSSGINLTTEGNVTMTHNQLILAGGCLNLPAVEGLRLTQGATIMVEFQHDTDDDGNNDCGSIVDQARQAVLVDVSSNTHTLIVSVGPGNSLFLFARRLDGVTVMGTAVNSFSSAQDIIAVVIDVEHVAVLVNDRPVIVKPWRGGLQNFSGALSVGCSRTHDHFLSTCIKSLEIHTGVTWVHQKLISQVQANGASN
eukprot:m.54190 g.54190  ORF g.54190 m.54190 type:complete len:441 (+) comp12852_c0_seq1:202-1524(+)